MGYFISGLAQIYKYTIAIMIENRFKRSNIPQNTGTIVRDKIFGKYGRGSDIEKYSEDIKIKTIRQLLNCIK